MKIEYDQVGPQTGMQPTDRGRIGSKDLMLHATPRSAFSWDFTVRHNDEVMAEIDMSWFRERAEVTISNQTYSVHRESITQGTFALQVGDQVLARARKVSAFTRAFEIDLSGRRLELRALSVWRREFGLFEKGAEIGRVRPTSWLGRQTAIELPDDMPLPVQVFLFWLVVVLWRRSASAGSASH